MSTDPYTASALQNYLNNTIYNQAVVKWTVVKLADMTVNFDLNNDGDIDVSSWTTDEQDEIIGQCNPVGYDKVVFIVDNPNQSYCGVSHSGSRYAFVFPNLSTNHTLTTAHELGHAAFSLSDINPNSTPPTNTDFYNLMWYTNDYLGTKLRMEQWGQIN